MTILWVSSIVNYNEKNFQFSYKKNNGRFFDMDN